MAREIYRTLIYAFSFFFFIYTATTEIYTLSLHDALPIFGRDREFADSPLEGAGFEPVWGFSCQAVVLGCADSFLFGAGKAVFRPVAWDQVRGARGRGQEIGRAHV